MYSCAADALEGRRVEIVGELAKLDARRKELEGELYNILSQKRSAGGFGAPQSHASRGEFDKKAKGDSSSSSSSSDDDDDDDDEDKCGRKMEVKKPRVKKDPNKPRRPFPAYLSFVNAKREEVKEQLAAVGPVKFTEVARVLGERWRAMSEEERLPYTNAAAQDKLRYEQELAAYKLTH